MVLEVISCYCLELTGKPTQITLWMLSKTRKYNRSTDVADKRSHPTGQGQLGFYSRLFLVPKKIGKYRPVINLRPLHRWIHFKMEGIHVVRDLLAKEDYLTHIYLKDAYLVIPIHHRFHKLIRFHWEGQYFKFECLLFGLSSAPCVFTKVEKVVLAFCTIEVFVV